MTSRGESRFDHSSDPNFLEYYAAASLSPAAIERFSVVRDKLLALARAERLDGVLDIADIGCGAGTQCRIWTQAGHRAHGLDVNGPLIDLARRRAAEEGHDIEFTVGTATELPYAAESMDVVLLPELLEHVADWKSCLNEATRVLRPGGLLYLSTTSYLCPRQEEFNLPMYSWYPGFLKRRYERLAVTTRPELANYAKYPAVNWFSFPMLSRYLRARGLNCFDRFDMMDSDHFGSELRLALLLIRKLRPLRLAAYMFTPYTIVFGVKQRALGANQAAPLEVS